MVGRAEAGLLKNYKEDTPLEEKKKIQLVTT